MVLELSPGQKVCMVVLNHPLDIDQDLIQLEIPINGLSRGIYVVEIWATGNVTERKRILVLDQL